MPIVVLILIALLVLLASRGEERPPTPPSEKPLELPPPSKEDFSRFWNRVKGYWGYVRKYSREAGVDPYLTLAVIWAESSGRKDAKRKEDSFYSYGLMQVTYRAALDVGFEGYPEDLMDPETNIKYGTRYLAAKIREFGWTENPTLYGVAAYNAGAGNVSSWLRKGLTPETFPEPTRTYLKNVNRYWRAVIKYAP